MKTGQPPIDVGYRASLQRCLQRGCYVVVATSGLHGPTTCNGLPIVSYTHDGSAAESPVPRLLSTSGQNHVTPWCTTQPFTAVLVEREV